jgi:hypothetical protein
MDRLCEIILNSDNEEFERNHQKEINIIKYFIKQSKVDIISFDNTDRIETANYIADMLHQYFKSFDKTNI